MFRVLICTLHDQRTEVWLRWWMRVKNSRISREFSQIEWERGSKDDIMFVSNI